MVKFFISGIGVDMEEVKRFRGLPYKSQRSFYEKIFTAREIKYCLSKADPYPHFAARFAAKEAVIKAVGKSTFHIKSIEILNNKKGKPEAKIKDRKAKTKNKLMVSLSHTKDHAVAIALWLN